MGNVGKAFAILLWFLFSLAMIVAIWQGRMVVGLLVFRAGVRRDAALVDPHPTVE